MNKRDFKQSVLNNGCISIDKDGECNFVVIQINDENFKDISSKLKQQLENENKYGSWIGFTTFEKQPPYTVQMLPIYGDSQNYVTKWFTNTAEETIDRCLNDKQMRLLSRANNYKGDRINMYKKYSKFIVLNMKTRKEIEYPYIKEQDSRDTEYQAIKEQMKLTDLPRSCFMISGMIKR